MSPKNFKLNIGIIRYFFSAAILSFAAYVYTDGHPVFLVLMGPPIYLANLVISALENALNLHIANIDLWVLLPCTLIYYCFTGFLIKQLLQEKPLRRYLCLAGLIGFAGYIHFLAWKDLSAYLSAR